MSLYLLFFSFILLQKIEANHRTQPAPPTSRPMIGLQGAVVAFAICASIDLSPLPSHSATLISPPSTIKVSSSADSTPSPTKRLKKTEDFTATGSVFLNGLLSGAATRASKEIVLHPLDTIKTRRQMPPIPPYNTSSGSASRLFSRLYDGLVPSLIGGIPAGAVFFAVKDASRDLLLRAHLAKPIATICAVAIANGPYWLIRSPAELLKTREQTKNSLHSSDWTLLTPFTKTRRQELFSSYTSNLVYALPADILKFLACELSFIYLHLFMGAEINLIPCRRVLCLGVVPARGGNEDRGSRRGCRGRTGLTRGTDPHHSG